MLNETTIPRSAATTGAPASWLRAIAPLAYIIALILIVGALVPFPVRMLLCGSFRTAPPGAAGSFTLQNYIVSYSSPFFIEVVLNSLFIGAAATFFSIALGVF